MNSPGRRIPAPNTNMTKKSKRIQNKNKMQKRKASRPKPKSRGNQMVSSSAPIPGTAYGAVIGARKYFPMTQGVGRDLVVSNFEQVGVSFTGTGGFTAGGSVLNAGVTTNYPWLSTIAQNYQKFRWKFLRYIYVPQCATTTPGSIWMQMYNDPFDSAPTSLAQVTAGSSSVVGNAWFGSSLSAELCFSEDTGPRDAICITIDCSRFSQPWYYIRQASGDTLNTVALTGTPTGGLGTLAISASQTFEYTTRPGTIYYGTNGITNGLLAGDLYVSYVCELSEPILAAAQN